MTGNPSWDPDPWVLAPLALAAVAYAAGRTALARAPRDRGGPVRGREAAAFAAGLASIALAVLSPMDGLSERLLSVHAGQHELLAIVAAPLLVVGRPLVPFLLALPPRWRPRALALARRPAVLRSWATLTAPLVAVLLHAAVRWAWHAPPLLDAALAHPAVHAVQHLCLFLTALLLWWAVVHGHGGARPGVSAAAVLATGAQLGLLAALVTRAPAPLYGTYARLLGERALVDQQAAGLVMGVPALALVAMAGLALLAGAIVRPSRRPRREPA